MASIARCSNMRIRSLRVTPVKVSELPSGLYFHWICRWVVGDGTQKIHDYPVLIFGLMIVFLTF